MNKIKVILVDDHTVVRDGIKALIKTDNNIDVIGEAGSYNELMQILDYHTPDILILDVSLPNKSGIDITKELSENKPEISIMILSMFTDENFVINAIKSGAKAYLPKNTNKIELLEAINTVYKGEEYFSKKISNIIYNNMMKELKGNKSPKPLKENLTKRETEVLRLFAEGYSNSEIADTLFISIRTVESHKSHIMTKLELKSNVDMIKYAIKNNIISI
jgi:DNA-binding NarL/FixJ family response regulator